MGKCYSDAVSIPCSGLPHVNGFATERLRGSKLVSTSPQTRGMQTEEEDKEENDDEVIVNLQTYMCISTSAMSRHDSVSRGHRRWHGGSNGAHERARV